MAFLLLPDFIETRMERKTNKQFIYKEVELFFRELLADNPANYDAHIALVLLLLLNRRLDEAQRHIVKLDQDDEKERPQRHIPHLKDTRLSNVIPFKAIKGGGSI